MRGPGGSGRSRRESAPAPIVVALSGADGSGKSTVAAALAARLEAEGHAVIGIYTYGCVVCRRVPGPLRLTVAGGRPPGTALPAERLLRIFNDIHAVVDAAELRVRLWAATRAARRRWSRDIDRRFPRSRACGREAALRIDRGRVRTGRSGEECAPRPIVIGERSPLDGLVKYGAVAGTMAGTVLRRAASAYALVVWLDAPPALLVERDHEHDPVVLHVLASRFERFASTLPRTIRVDAAAPVGDVVATIVDRLDASPDGPVDGDGRRMEAR